MNYIHSRRQLNKGDIVELTCEEACNFMLTDDSNFALYKKGDTFSYYGGHFDTFPAKITAPQSGDWNIIIDAPGGNAIANWDMKIVK